jgi:acyl carrier protein
MTLTGSNPIQRTWPQRDFDTDRVRGLVAEYLGINVQRVTDEAHLSDDLGVDWLDRIELMILIEDNFTGVEISDDDANRVELVGDLIRHIEKRQREQTTVENRQNRGLVFGGSAY